MTDANPLYNPRWSSEPSDVKVAPQPPVLREGFDRLWPNCTTCGSAFVTHAEAMGGELYGTLSCTMCGTVLAYTVGSRRYAVGSEHVPLGQVPTPTVPERTHLVARNWRVDGCSVACYDGHHSPEAHERYGREQALTEIAAQRERPSGKLRTGRLTVDFDRQRVLVDDDIVPASELERRILFYLAEHIGTTCRHWDTVSAVWGRDQAVIWSRDRHSTGAWHGARIHVHRLRRRLGVAAELIETVPSVGYLLRAEPPV